VVFRPRVYADGYEFGVYINDPKYSMNRNLYMHGAITPEGHRLLT
jgi:hypothetical protein